MNNTDLIPNVSVGQIKFGTSITEYLVYEYTFFEKDADDTYMEDNYEFVEPPLIVFVDSLHQVTTINCKIRCFWKHTNLIGLPIDKFIELAGENPDNRQEIYMLITADKGQTQTVYDFENLGLQIWTWESKIVTVSCTNYDLIDETRY